LLCFDSNCDGFEIDTNKVGGWNSECVRGEIDTLKESSNIINTLSNGPRVLELTGLLLGPASFEYEVLHRILETSLESFSFSGNISSQSGSIKKIAFRVSR
jgi:hypothetical protein